MCSEFSFGSASVLLLPQPRGIRVFVWSDVCTKKSLYILHDTKTKGTHSSGHQEPLLPLQVFLFFYFFSFVLHEDRFVKKIKKGAEVSAGERHRQGRGGKAL